MGFQAHGFSRWVVDHLSMVLKRLTPPTVTHGVFNPMPYGINLNTGEVILIQGYRLIPLGLVGPATIENAGKEFHLTC